MTTATIPQHTTQKIFSAVPTLDATTFSLEDYIRVYGDSPETLQGYLQAQVEQARREMENMTIMDNAFEIRALCSRINVLRNRMNKLFAGRA